MKLVTAKIDFRAMAVRTALAMFTGCFFSLPSLAVLTGLADIKDVRVEPILQSQWTVGEFGGDKAFNLYTPNNYSCSCGITAGAQIMRYWRAPSGSVAPKSFSCWVGMSPQTFTTMGGTYDWDAMPLQSDDCVAQSQREALGHLTYDLGVASHVAYIDNRISFCSGVFLIAALRDYFGYASARLFMGSESRQNLLSLKDYKNAILASLDAGMPVVIGIRTAANEGHQVVVDGYGFGEDNKVYCHVNFGWKGASDGWYNLIEDDFAAGGAGETPYQFGFLEEVAYNIDPQTSGDVISGRVLDSSGNPVPNVKVTFGKDGNSAILAETLTNAKGIYSFRFSDKGKYRVSANDATHGQAKLTVSVSKVGGSPLVSSSLDFSKEYSSFMSLPFITMNSMAVANSWGNDLTLDGSSVAPVEPEEPEAPIVVDPQPTGPFFAAATVFDGYLLDGDNVAGTILVKAGKSSKSSESKLTATVILKEQEKKLSYKGLMEASGNATLASNGQTGLTLKFDEQTISGNLGGYTVSGTRNLFMSKDKGEVAKANDTLKSKLGVVNVVAWDESGLAGSLSLTIAAKGKVKVTGMLDGKKVSSTAQVLLGETGCHLVPVVIAKPAPMAFMLWLFDGSENVDVTGTTDFDCFAGKVGVLGSSARFWIDREADIWGQLQGTVLVDQLPDVAISQSGVGAKWGVPKAGKVAYLSGTTEVDPSKAGENPSGLKLTYKAKDGTFKGSFKVYSDMNGKLKATTVNVTGVQIDGCGYGTATVKGVGSIPVMIE